jgi:hypothetical protein
MSTVAEIEAALTRLSPEDLRRVEAILRRLQENGPADVAELERRNGFDAFPRRQGGQVTVEVVRQLCAEEGV